MKKLATFLFLITTVVLFTSKIAFAEDKVPVSSTVAASTAIVTPAASAQSVTDAVYAELLSKIEIKNNLVLKENQVCKEIKAQENINKEKAAAIIGKSQSYSAAYNKIIDDIKSLLDPIREKQALYYKDSIQNKTDTSNTAGKEASIYDSQISNLNLAIKAMRESMKYISLESMKYRQNLEAVQKNIDKINLSIEELNKEIVADKVSKDKEWDNFSSAMFKGDLKAANESYDNIIKLKEHIIQNYNGILMYKKSIGELLASIEKM